MFSSLAETTWGFPIVSALHVMGLAWFGGVVLAPREFPRLERWALLFMLVTGAALFLMQPAHYLHSVGFWIKLSLLFAVLIWRRAGTWSALVLWFGVVCAARAMAFV